MYLSAIPAIRTPFGMDVFDYQIDDASKLRRGDLILVPFRKNPTPALVASINQTSRFAGKAIHLETNCPLARLGETVADLLDATAQHTFTSRTSVLLAWLRKLPKRAQSFESEIIPQTKFSLAGKRTRTLAINRFETIINEARRAKGRVLIITPWKNRAEVISQLLSASALHADIAGGSAWKAWSNFVRATEGKLVTTRIGAWLSACADTVIIDEPENDDFKQDESSPRFDSRWLVTRSAELNPALNTIEIGTTPKLEKGFQEAPAIELELRLEPWQKGSYSSVEGLSGSIVEEIASALENRRAITILHPIKGERARIVCRDCGWMMKCEACNFQLSRVAGRGYCGLCGRSSEIPFVCEKCGGSDLNKGRAGKDRVAEQVQKYFNSDLVQAIDLPDWNRLALKPNSLVILTDMSLIGGYAEDIRKRERLVIAWRRLCASVSMAKGTLIAQGPEDLLSQARSWLAKDGFAGMWTAELKERSAFAYPPMQKRIKLLVGGSAENAERLKENLLSSLPSAWRVEGPFLVQFRAKTRSERQVIHVIPPKNETELQIAKHLEPFAGKAIIDLDPIAFFS